jgi:drug/metabolite transporter (DMT)-like permease
MRPGYLILLIILNFFWAASLSAYKVCEEFLTPGGIVTLRFGVAAISLLVLWPWLPGAAPRGRDLAKTVVMGLLVFTVGQRLQVIGNQLSTASNSAILVAIEPLITAIAAAIFLREHIGPRRLAGFAFGILGVALLNGVWSANFQWMGLGANLIFISSFFCETAYSILGKKIMHSGAVSDPGDASATDDAAAQSAARRSEIGPIKILALALVVGTVANLLIDGPKTFAAAGRMSAQAWILIGAMALICTSFGYSFWYLVIREGEVNVAALTVFAQPVFGVILARCWLGETLHWGQLWGTTAIVCGLIIGLSRQIKKQPAASAPEHSS